MFAPLVTRDTSGALFAPGVASTPPGMISLDLLATRVHPDLGAVGGPDLRRLIGALVTYGLLTAVMMLIICAAAWGLAAARGSWPAAEKAKGGLFVALAGTVLIGGSMTWANWLLGVGVRL